MAIIGVDIDGTVVGTDIGWYEWAYLTIHKSEPPPITEPLPYNLQEYFKVGDWIWDYWRDEHLYDRLKPFEDSVEVLKKLSEKNEIVFISRIKGNHHKSKYYFIERNFPFFSEVVYCQKKQYVKCDVMIDDRLSVLRDMDCKRILFDRPFLQDVNEVDVHKFITDYECSFRTIDNWKDIGRIL